MRVATLTFLTVAAAMTLAACSKAPETTATTTSGETTAAAAPVAALTDADKAALLASLPAPYNTGNIENGRKTFLLCRSCHNITPGGPNATGPNLFGIIGRKAGSHEGFKYSDVVKNAGFVWDPEKLDLWLADPKSDLPGNRMTFPGIKDAQKRIDLIAYLKVEASAKPGG